MELAEYLRILRKSWLFITIVALVGLGIGATAALVQRPVYQSSALVFVSTQSGDTVGELAQGNSFTLQRVNTYASLADTQAVLQPVIDELGLEASVADMASIVTATPQTDTTIIEVMTHTEDPVAAAELANAVASSLTLVVADIETSDSTEAVSPVRLEVVEPAAVPAQPVSPRVPLYLSAGLVLGVLVAVLASIFRAILDTRIRGEADVASVTDLSLVGGIAFDPKATERPLIVQADPLNPRAEAYRALRTNLQFVEVDDGSKSFVVTSSMPGEGKSTTTANLALALADAGGTVLLVDADLRKPKIAQYLGVEGRVGLTDVLIGRVALVDAVQQWGDGGLYVLPAGQVPPNPSELLGSKAMKTLIGSLEREFDWIIFDAPPLLPVTDAAILSKNLTGAIVAVAAGKTTRHQLESALSVLETVGAPVAGVVLTFMPTKGSGAYGYGAYGYGHYGYAQEEPQAKPRRRRTARATSTT